MNTGEFITELTASLGNNTMLTQARYVQWLNWALLDLCGMHRKRAFSPKRFKILEAKKLFSTIVLTDTLVSSTSTACVLAVAHQETVDDFYEDMVIELTDYSGTAPTGLLNQVRQIIDYDYLTNTITISEAWTVTPDASTTYAIYRREYDLTADVGIDAHDHVWGIQRLETTTDGTKLEHKDWRDLVGVAYTTTGTPSSFGRRENNLLFDTTPDTVVSYRMWYYRYPTQFTTADLTAECELPEDWHEAIVLGAIWRGFKSLMEPQRADQAYQLYINEVTNKQDAYMWEEKYIDKGIRVRKS